MARMIWDRCNRKLLESGAWQGSRWPLDSQKPPVPEEKPVKILSQTADLEKIREQFKRQHRVIVALGMAVTLKPAPAPEEPATNPTDAAEEELIIDQPQAEKFEKIREQLERQCREFKKAVAPAPEIQATNPTDAEEDELIIDQSQAEKFEKILEQLERQYQEFEKAAAPAPNSADAARKRGLNVVEKFETQLYLRVPRARGYAEVAHINFKTKRRGRCVVCIRKAKAEKSDMGLIREFILTYAEQLTYDTEKLLSAGITNAAAIARASDATLLEAFGC